MKRPAFLLAALLLLLFAAMEMKGGLVPSGGDGPALPGSFDTVRAMGRLQRILGDQRPHPADTAANDAVRGRLIAELRAMGIEPAVRDAIACNGHGANRGVACARVRNVVASIGPAEGRRVLLVSHYDSTPVGPGDSDDGIGVATILETASLLKGQKLARPVTLLFDEGEEAGLLGARAFLQNDPLAASVDTAVNFESRGVTGPAIMFETSRPNGAAVAHFARAAKRPVANSMTADFYRLIPNSTDVTVLAERPWTLLNFAVIGNETRYHSPGDTLAALDPRSVRHMGEQAVALTQELARGSPAPAGEKLYADLLGTGLVAFPLWAGLALLAVLALGFAGFTVSRRQGLARAPGAIIGALAGSAALAWLGQFVVGLMRHGVYWRAHPEMIAAAVDLSALAACALLLAWIGRPLDRDRLRTGFWMVFLLLGAGLSLIAPGASIFFLAPPLIAGLGMAAARRWPRVETPAALAAASLLFLTWAPLLHLIEVLLDFPATWTFAPVAALIALPVLIELKPLFDRGNARWAVPALAAAALAGWIGTALAPAYSMDRKQGFGIEYVWSQPERKGRWLLAVGGAPVPPAFAALGRFRAGFQVPWAGRSRWCADAPALPQTPPTLEKMAERTVPAGRLLTLRLRTGGADNVLMRAGGGSGLVAVRAGGSMRRFGAGEKDDPFTLRCHGRSCDGMLFDLLVAKPGPLELTVAGIRAGLPSAAAPLLRARPAEAAPQYYPDATVSMDRVRL